MGNGMEWIERRIRKNICLRSFRMSSVFVNFVSCRVSIQSIFLLERSVVVDHRCRCRVFSLFLFPPPARHNMHNITDTTLIRDGVG